MLNISSANIGYDIAGMNKLINDVNTECVTPACVAMRREVANLRQTIDTVWVGKSADAFKDKISRDTEDLCKTLETVGEMIREQMNNAGSNVEAYDQEIARTLFGASGESDGPTLRRPSTPSTPAPSYNPNEPSQQNIIDESKTPTPAPETPTPAPVVEPTPAPVVEPTPVEPAPAPVEPTPTPVEPTPVEPTPGTPPAAPEVPETPKPEEPKSEETKPEEPKPEEPAPVEPTPVEPTPAPVEPTPVEPTPVEPAPAPVEPTPVEPTPVEPTPTPGDTSYPTPATGDKSIDQLRDEFGLRGENTIDNKFGYYDDGLTATQTDVLNKLDQFGQANGIPHDQMKDWAWIMCRESGFKPEASNGTHFGLGQLTESNIAKYAPSGDYSTNVNTQIQATYNYIMDTYGSIEAAKSFWQSNGWY